MPLVRAVCSVMYLQDSVLAKLVIKGTNVMLLVDVTTLVHFVQHVIRPRVNALAKLDTPDGLVIPVPPTTTDQVVELAQVSITLWKYVLQCFFMCTYFQPVVAMPLVQAICSVLILQVSVLAKLDTLEELVIPVTPTTTEQAVELAKVSIIL